MIHTGRVVRISGFNFSTLTSALIGNSAEISHNEILRKLFSNGEQGFAYNPNDLSTLYQDTAGTIPVTSVGQPVGLMRDKSGQEKHALQSNANLRPIILERGLRYPVNSRGFIVNVPVDITNCTIIMSSQKSVFGIATGQTVIAGSIDITPEGFCLVINRLLTAREIGTLKEVINRFTAESLYWQLNSQRLMWNTIDTTLMWS